MPTTALLVIDIQRGAFDGVRCPPIDGAETLVANAGVLVAAARSASVPIVFVQHCEGPGEPFEEGSAHGEFVEALAPQPGDTVIRKRASSAFEGTALGATLAQWGVAEIAVCGLQSEHCVSNTSKSALALGLRVRVAQDGHGTWPWQGRSSQDIAAAANDDLAALGAQVELSAAVAARLRAQH